jgi:hypothetical protein
MRKKRSREYYGRKKGYRSGLEEAVGKQLKDSKVDAKYESKKIEYLVPARKATYTPDFILPNGIIIETKGRFVAEDRKKHLLIREQIPELDIRFVFTNPNSKIRKGSKTSYADWCDKNGFKYAKGNIPEEWMK